MIIGSVAVCYVCTTAECRADGDIQKNIINFEIGEDEFCIKLAEKEDAEDICVLTNKVFEETDTTRAENHRRFDNKTSVENGLDNKTTAAWFVMRHNEKLVGSVQVKNESDKYSFTAFVIDRDYKGKGLGERLLEVVENFVVSRNANEISCTVMCRAKEPIMIEGNWDMIPAEVEREPYKLVDYYKNLGYSETGYIELPPLEYQKKTRLEQYYMKIFFLELKKSFS